MHDNVHGPHPVTTLEASKGLADPSLEPVTHNRITDLAAGCDTEPNILA